MSRETLDALSEYHEVNLFLRGIVPTLGYQTSKVYYERGEREAGESKYPLKKMIAFAIQGITSFSTKPLSFVTGAGLLSILVAIGMFVYVLVSLGFGHAIAGWGSMMISIWLIGGLIMLSLASSANTSAKFIWNPNIAPVTASKPHCRRGRRPADGPLQCLDYIYFVSSHESTRIAMPLLEAEMRPSPFSCLAITKR